MAARTWPESRGGRYRPSAARRDSVLAIHARKNAAQAQSAASVSHAIGEPSNPNVFAAPCTAEGTMSFELLTAACSSIGSNRLWLVFSQSHAKATESATTCSANKGNDCP